MGVVASNSVSFSCWSDRLLKFRSLSPPGWFCLMILWDCYWDELSLISSDDCCGKFFNCKLIYSRNCLVSSATGEINYLIRSKLSTAPQGPFWVDEVSSMTPTGDTSSVRGFEEQYLDEIFDYFSKFEFLLEEKFKLDLARFEFILLFCVDLKFLSSWRGNFCVRMPVAYLSTLFG